MANFFSTPRPKPFKIEPRYWDPKKEERLARERRIKSELGLESEDGVYRPYISKGDFRKGFSNGKWSIDRKRRASNTRLLIIVILLGLLFYYFLR